MFQDSIYKGINESQFNGKDVVIYDQVSKREYIARLVVRYLTEEEKLALEATEEASRYLLTYDAYKQAGITDKGKGWHLIAVKSIKENGTIVGWNSWGELSDPEPTMKLNRSDVSVSTLDVISLKLVGNNGIKDSPNLMEAHPVFKKKSKQEMEPHLYTSSNLDYL